MTAFFAQQTRRLSGSAAVTANLVLAGFGRAGAAVLISSQATQNMSCSAGVCTPTATRAWLNAGDLETMLASGNATVKTTGSGVEAKDITVSDGFSWTSGSTMTLDAYHSVTVDKPVSVQGLAGLAILTNDGGSKGLFLFGKRGNVSFANLSSSLFINGVAYQLENSIAVLASAIATNPSGAYALANSYDASQDGTYSASPIPTTFAGIFEGLGNVISNLTINDQNNAAVGFFTDIASTGSVENLQLESANLTGNGSSTGPLAAVNEGSITNASASGVVSGASDAGGLVGGNIGTLYLTHASSVVQGFTAGGLVGDNSTSGVVEQSYATGKVVGREDSGGLVGLAEVGLDTGRIENSYATGTANGGSSGVVGGLVGADTAENSGSIESSYSMGKVKGTGGKTSKGGFVGYDLASGDIMDCYWDLDTSGISNPKRGAGNRKSDFGITGLTTKQLQSGLPQGFDEKIWAEDANINEGLPYLLANPPK